jgi:hypothetical protein
MYTVGSTKKKKEKDVGERDRIDCIVLVPSRPARVWTP